MARIRRDAWPESFRPLYDEINPTYRCRLGSFLEFAKSILGSDEFGPGDVDTALVQAYVDTKLLDIAVPALSSRLYGFFRSVELALPHIRIPAEIWRHWNDIAGRSYKPKGKCFTLPPCFQRSLAVPFADWPPFHREQWTKIAGKAAATKEHTTLAIPSGIPRKYGGWRDDFPAPARRLKESTATHAENVYSAFLYFVRSHDLPDDVTLSSVRAWLRACADRGLPNGTQGVYASRLKTVMIRCEPDCDWSFLTRLSFDLIKKHADKTKRSDVSAEELFAIGLRTIRKAIESPRRSARTAILFRDGLLLCFLITAVLRSGNVAALRLGVNLILGTLARVELSGSDMKNRRSADIRVPEEIAALIDLYIREFRPALRVTNDQLWRALPNGAAPDQALSQKQINVIIKSLVKRMSGQDVHVHLTRHAAAEFMATQFPEQANLIRKLLLHESLTVAETYTGPALAAAASRRLQEANMAARADAERRLNERTSRSIGTATSDLPQDSKRAIGVRLERTPLKALSRR